MLKRTKIVATISDKRCDVDFIRGLYNAGMNVARLNTAHMNPETAKSVIAKIREVSDSIAILVDTKGPEIRTSSLGFEIKVETGNKIKIIGNPEGTSGGDTVYVSYSNIAKEVPVGNSLLIDDGELELKVLEKNETTLFCEVMNC